MLSIDTRLCYRFRWPGGVIWEISVEMTEAMMNDLNASLQRQINQHLRAFVR